MDAQRHAEYYGMQRTFDELYAKSKAGETFTGLMELVLSPDNIMLAYRNIKTNTGSYTTGTDKQNIGDIGRLPPAEVIGKIRKIVTGSEHGYRPKPVRRKDIPKPNGKTRPLGIPCIWDRLVHQCIKQILEPICEAKFSNNSYGFRPNRSVEHAISRTYSLLQRAHLHYVLEFDIKGFFDNVNHSKLMVANDPNVFNLLCNCGTPQDYYSLPYMTQIATADPTSVDQTRRRVKAYKALMGDYFPVTADHNNIWYPSAVGTGSVLIEKRDLSGTAKEEYEKWLGIADTVQLQKGRFIGDLYSYGFDPYETYVVEKDGVMYYAFYKDGSKYSPTGYPDIELKGLDPNKMYRIVDYVNDRVVATNLMGDNAVFNTRFSDYLLVKAVEISEPDPEPVDPDYGFTSVDDRDEALIYTGTWHDDNNASFSEGTARYTNSTDASVVFSFTGTSIRWYGQRDTNFGTAEVYLDDELKTTVDANGAAEAGVCLFEALDLPAAEHTIKIVCKSGVIDIDRFAYEAATLEPIYEKVDALSDRITYVGNWEEYHNSEFYMGNAMRTDEAGAYAELTFRGTAVRLYAEMSFNFGTADVYLDGELVENIILYGQEATGQLMFERTGLEEGEHTIRLVQNAWNINLDYISYLPEQDQPTPPETTVTVDAMDAQLVYTGVWNDDYHDVFQEGTARYAISAGASVEFEFTGSEIRWYGQNDSNFGVASVYIDNEFVQQVNVNGAAAVGKLLFQKTDLPAGSHTIRIVCDTPVIDLDYLTYTTKA